MFSVNSDTILFRWNCRNQVVLNDHYSMILVVILSASFYDKMTTNITLSKAKLLSHKELGNNAKRGVTATFLKRTNQPGKKLLLGLSNDSLRLDLDSSTKTISQLLSEIHGLLVINYISIHCAIWYMNSQGLNR